MKEVRELYGVMHASHVEHGVFVTSSIFTTEAREFAQGKNLELVDGEGLINIIRQLPADEQDALLYKVFSRDYSVPTCPNCDTKMVERTARKGPSIGSHFWGCPNYPRCRKTFQMRGE